MLLRHSLATLLIIIRASFGPVLVLGNEPAKSDIEKALDEFRKFSHEEAVEIFKKSYKDSFVEKVFSKDSPIYDVFADIVKDRKLTNELLRVKDDRKMLYWFIGLNILVFILSRWLKHIYLKRGGGFIYQSYLFIKRFILILSIRLGLIYWFYQPIVKPIINSVRKHFQI